VHVCRWLEWLTAPDSDEEEEESEEESEEETDMSDIMRPDNSSGLR
jgi:hypothetical protein